MKKTKKIVWLGIYLLFLSSCAKQSDNMINNVEEIITTQEKTILDTTEAANNTQKVDEDTLNGVSLFNVKDYLSDEHFYNQDEIDFVQTNYGQDQVEAASEDTEIYDTFHIKVLEAYTFDESSIFNEYLSEQHLVDATMKRAEEMYGKDSFTWLCLPVEITNTGDIMQTVSVGSFWLYTRIDDDRLVEYGLSDKYITLATTDASLWYDYPNKVNESKSYKFVNMQPGETISTNIFYLILKENLDKDLYISLYWNDDGVYDKKLNCNFPSTNEEVKFIKVTIKKGE